MSLKWERTGPDTLTSNQGHKILRFRREGVPEPRYAAYGPPGSADMGWLQAPLHAALRDKGVPIPRHGGVFSPAPAWLGEYDSWRSGQMACERHAQEATSA